jgi:hypothetical protein
MMHSPKGGNIVKRKFATLTVTTIMILSLMAVVQAEDDYIELTLDFDNLQPLESGHYEGWLIVDGSPVSTGKFTIDADGQIMDLDGDTINKFRVPDLDLEMATMFVLSIEPDGDTDALPAAIKPLAGGLNAAKDGADLAHNVGVDLSGLAGAYILATPTDNHPTDDFELDLDFLNLPMLSTGHYEGWLIVDGSPVSTGKFNVDAGGDLVDLMGMALDGPFMVMDLMIEDVTKFVLSIEPEGDTDDVPAAVKPLAGDVDGTGLGGTIAHNVGVTLSGVGGKYILATPTNNFDYALDLAFDNLAPLASGHYEGWLIVDGAPISTGKFNIDEMGALVDYMTAAPLDGAFILEDLDNDNVEMFVLSIEAEGDDDAIPGDVKPLAGAVDGTGMAGAISHNIGVDLSGIGGEYIFATPSNGADTDELSGIWFLNRSTGTPVAGLDLPDLSSTDWTYEGWVVIDGVPVTSGRFDMVDGTDDFDGYSGTMGIPPFPGEDYLVNAPSGLTFPTNLTGLPVVISIEPRVDTDAGPFQFKPLVGISPDPAMDHLEYGLDDMTDTLATGTFALSQAATDELSGIWFLDRSSGSPVAGLDLPDLAGTDWVYEGWVVIDGVPVTTGTFDGPEGADAFDGYSSTLGAPPFPGEDFIVDAPDGLTFPTDLTGQTVVISIEPRMDDDPSPFFLKPLMGAVPDPAVDHLEYDLDDITSMLPSGTFALTQMDPGPSNELSGIWFLDPSSGTVMAGLDLPDLSGTDWTYEGWVVIDGVPVTTGRFDMASGADGFDGYSSTEAAPPFPGEDFLMEAPDGLTFPTDLSGTKAVISIEPRMDDDAGPFQFKPLVGDVPADAEDHVVYDLMDLTSTLPTGTVSITQVSADDGDGESSLLLWTGLVVVIVAVVAVAGFLMRRPGQ